MFVWLKPSFWLMNNPYHKEWDRFVNTAIDNDCIVFDGKYTAKIHGKDMWVGNYPFAYGVSHSEAVRVRPSRKTIQKLYDHQIKKMTE